MKFPIVKIIYLFSILISSFFISCQDKTTFNNYQLAIQYEKNGNLDSSIVLLKQIVDNSENKKEDFYLDAKERLASVEKKREEKIKSNAENLFMESQILQKQNKFLGELKNLREIIDKYPSAEIVARIRNRIIELEVKKAAYEKLLFEAKNYFDHSDYVKARQKYQSALEVIFEESTSKKIDECNEKLIRGMKIDDGVFVLESVRLNKSNGSLWGYSHFIYTGKIEEVDFKKNIAQIRIKRIQRWWEDTGFGTLFKTEGPRESHITSMPFRDERNHLFSSSYGNFYINDIISVRFDDLLKTEEAVTNKLPQRFRKDLINFIELAI